MDRVRLGRALGYGARHAVKTVAAVAEAATAPNPAGNTSAARPEPTGASAPPVTRRVPSAAVAKKAGRSVLAPLATYSSALWLRVTGLFFAMIASVMASGAWRTRAALHGAATDGGRHFWVFAVFAVLFGYFAVSGFLRANARERRNGRS